MKMTKERKAYAVGLVAAVGFLVYCQVPGGATAASAASAAPEDPSALLAAKPDASAAPAAQPLGAVVTVADRLREYGHHAGLDPADASDAFFPQSMWASALFAPKQSDTADAKPVISAATLFPQHHRLNAILVSPSESRAIIDGQVLSVGQAIDGFTLVSLAQTSAVMHSPSTGQEVVLRIVEPSAAPVGTVISTQGVADVR